MRLHLTHCALLAALALAGTLHAQDLPRLDGSNVPQDNNPAPNPPAAWGGPTATPSSKPWPKALPATPSAGNLTPMASAPLKGKVALEKTPAGRLSSAMATPTTPSNPTPGELPAQPATVQFANGLLTVHATNSSLDQILRDTAVQTGMTMEGTPEDERVFGDFGPAPVNKVLAQLLDGGPSNYLLFGKGANAAPRSLVIMPRASLAPGEVLASSPAPAPVAAADDDDDDDTPVAQAPIRPLIPAQQAPQSASPNGQPNPGIRTPQQILEDMQRRRQQLQPQE